jgi:hypothetical protein
MRRKSNYSESYKREAVANRNDERNAQLAA